MTGGPMKAHPASRGVGPTVMTVTVKSVNVKSSEATCTEVNTGNEVVVFLNPQRAKGGIPRAGETWLIGREFGRWSFTGLLEWTRPTVAGNRLTADGLDLSLLDSLAALGLVTDGTLKWQTNALGTWGFSTSGADGFDTSTGTKTPLRGGIRIHRPPAGLNLTTPGHFVMFSMAWYNASNVQITVPTPADLYDPDYWLVTNGTPSTNDPTDYGNNPPYVDSPATAASYILAINDFGPYDSTGTTTLVAPAYPSYATEVQASTQARGF